MYNNLNSVIMEGNLTKDPSLSLTPKGSSVCTFSVASNRYYKTDDELVSEVSYFDVEAWAKLGEICSENLRKGRGVRVVGRLKQDRWKDPNGTAHSRAKIVAEHVEFQPSRKKEGDAKFTRQDAVRTAEAEAFECADSAVPADAVLETL